MLRRLRHRLEWALLRPALEYVRRHRAVSGVGSGEIAWRVSGARRRTAIENATPSCNGNGRRVARESFRHFGRTLVEAIRLSEQAPTVRWADPDHIAPILESGRPALVLSGHLGNWEVAAWSIQQRLSGRGRQLHLVVAPPSNPHAAAYAAEIREGWGVRVHPRERALRSVFAALRDGHIVGTAADQYPAAALRSRDESAVLRAPFLGRDTAFDLTLFRLATRLGIDIVPLAAVHDEDGGFELHTAHLQTSGADAHDVGRAWVDILDGWVRAWPEQYLWMHRRWKDVQ